jgi:hypothetical protein
MAEPFAEALADWTAFYALAGGAAATLLGLLFVAVSLRLNIFRREDIADVREFAIFTAATFLVAIAVAALALAPHEDRRPLSLALLFTGVCGLVGVMQIIRLWTRLNLPAQKGQRDYTLSKWQALAYLIGMSGAYIGLIVAALLLWNNHYHALGWLAITEGWQLGMGTVASWVLLSHAGDAEASQSE